MEPPYSDWDAGALGSDPVGQGVSVHADVLTQIKPRTGAFGGLRHRIAFIGGEVLRVGSPRKVAAIVVSIQASR